MDKQLGRELRKRFEEMMKAEYPHFQRDRKTEHPSGSRTYRSNLRNDFYGYIDLQPWPNYNTFAVELVASFLTPFTWLGAEMLDATYTDDSLLELLIGGNGSLRFFLGEYDEAAGHFKQGQWNVSAQKRLDNMYSLDAPSEFEKPNPILDLDFLSQPPPNINDDDKSLIKTSLEDVFQLLQKYGKPFFADVQRILSRYDEGYAKNAGR